ncbi:hypothetical protein EYC80_008794 [Monilinia laxa]|uniref:Uncharacterized protein n=1 Tax=Monilinia laxa TaxID=61186 RepID=A0A5N6K1E0_MONLA|nr:hypothetical protein EYC80_008794 [Monilinia laxa]
MTPVNESDKIIITVSDLESLRSLFIRAGRRHHYQKRISSNYGKIFSALIVDLDSRIGLLEDTFYSDSNSDINSEYQDEEQDQLEISTERIGSDMSSKIGNESKAPGVETNISSLGEERHTKSSDGAAPGSSGSFETAGNRAAEDQVDGEVLEHAIENLKTKNGAWWAYLLTRDFWIILLLGQILSLCITATNTFTTLLANKGTSIPAFQTLFNYIVLCLIYTTYTIYKYGWRDYFKLLLVDGWKYVILSFMDVEGNYFTVLAYRWTNVLSAQLLNFWSIVCVVIVSFIFLRVRYKWLQVIAILVCCGGMGILLASDHITGSNGGNPPTMLKGDLFGLAGATLYGLSNVFEEWFVSKRPMYEVLGMLGLFGIIINGITAAIFDRHSFETAVWDGQVGGYIVGYTLALTLFYTLAPIILRMASAAFFDISLLTANFWGVIIGIKVFGYTIYYLYPIAFVLIILGLFVYFLAGSMLGDAVKPWLGKDQQAGVAGVGTAKLKAIHEARRDGLVNSGSGMA